MIGVALLLAAAAPGDRHQVVAGWHVEKVAEQDGGILVTLSRRGPGWRFAYHLAFWRGNGGVYAGAEFTRGRCRSGDADMLRETEDAMARAAVDGWLADYLRECPLSAAREADLRRTLDRAWPTFIARASEAEEVTGDENEAIANYGRE